MFSTGGHLAPQLTHIGDLTVAVERPALPGRKPPVLLLHGMFGGAWQWERYQSQLARHGYESHALNLRGRFGSRSVPDIGKVSVGDLVDDAIEAARALGNPIVFGHSMGGMLAQKVAEAGLCRAAVLIGAAPPRGISVLGWELLQRLVRYARELIFSKALFPSRPDADALMFNRTPPNEREQQYAMLVPESGRAGLDLAIGVVGVNAARVTAPVLVLTGLDDRFIVPRVARALARKYHATLKEYENFAHNIIMEPGWEGPCAEIVEWMERL